MKKLFVAFCFFLTAFGVFGQTGKIAPQDLETLKKLEDTLGVLSFLVINDSVPEERFAVTKRMIPLLVQALKIPHSFEYPFEKLRTVSIQYPPDSTFRIFTWQLYVDVDDYRYYGAIQMNSPELKLYPLIDRSKQVNSEEQDILKPDTWFGALYYNLHQFDTPTGSQYLLFGFNGHSFFNKRKMVEVLRFDGGAPVFGAPVFVKTDTLTGEETTKNRIMLEYAAETAIRLNYDETYNMVLFDHLTLVGGNYGQGPTYVPDGTYEAYKLRQDGRWHWIEKVFTEVLDEAPRPSPVLGTEKKDIFGNEKKARKKE